MTTLPYDRTSTAEQVTEGRDLSGQTFLVTGCTAGLGLETARVLGLRGAHIIGLARTAAGAQQALDALGLPGDAVACELGDLESVRAAVAAVRALRPIDGLIANAGIMALPRLQQIAGVEQQLFVNHVGHFALVTGLLDRLAPAGRVVVLSSGAHRYAKAGLELDNASGEAAPYDPWRMYGRSKLANILFARSLGQRLADRGQTAYSVHPGVIETKLGRHVEDREAMYESLKNVLKTVEQGAATQVLVATHPAVTPHSGRYFSDCQPAETLPVGSSDEAAAALWAWTEAVVARA
jgi:NAD(P)-dependent dehydrogenase (short-subunit alcohol dehydrogenase family)